MTHKPMTDRTKFGFDYDIVLCGHVHEKWNRLDFIAENSKYEEVSVVQINVGVDVWNFRPITLEQIIKFI